MRRTFLASIMIIGAALAVVFGGGAFSSFSDVENISGVANAAIVDFELTSVNDGNTGLSEAAGDELLDLTFDDTDCTALGTQDFFAPGDSCTITVTIIRTPAADILKQLAVDLKVTGTSIDTDAADFTSTQACTNVALADAAIAATDRWNITIGALTDTVGGGDGDYFPAATADGATFTVTIQLDPAADNSCQADSITLSLVVTATTDDTPHNTVDTD